MKIVAITAGLSDPSSTRLLADRLTSATTSALHQRGATTAVEIIEVRTLAHDVVDALLTRVTTPALAQAQESVLDADALIVVTPTFSMSYSGMFKSFLDTFEEGALARMPVLLAATGGSERHSMVLESALRPLLSYLKAITVPTAVFAASEDWGHSGLERRIERAGADLAELVTALPQRRQVDPFDPEAAGFVSFADLLG